MYCNPRSVSGDVAGARSALHYQAPDGTEISTAINLGPIPKMIRNFLATVVVFTTVACSPMMLSHPALPASGAFVTQLGRDTIGIERYTRTADRLEGDLALRSPSVRVIHYSAGLDANGRMQSLTTTIRRPSMAPTAPALMDRTIALGVRTTVEITRNGKRDTTSGVRTYEGTGVPTLPSEPPSYGLYEQMIAAYLAPNTTARLTQIGGPGPQTAPLALSWRGPDSVQFSSGFFPPSPWLEIAAVNNGRIVGVNSSGTTIKTISHRDDNLDFNAVLNSWVTREATSGAMGPASTLDTARASIGGSNLEVVYSRPSKRGRVIFGNVVPWGEVWRTGANAATQLTTTRDLVIGGTTVPAGKYTLWTLPTPSGAQLIINSQTGQWGTDYDPKRDFARVDLTTTMLSTPTEKFTISIDPSGNGGVLRMAWDDRAYSVPFTVK